MRLGQEEELLQPGGEQRRPVAGGRTDHPTFKPIVVDLRQNGRLVALEQLPERVQRVRQDLSLRGRLEFQLELCGVVNPPVHAPAHR